MRNTDIWIFARLHIEYQRVTQIQFRCRCHSYMYISGVGWVLQIIVIDIHNVTLSDYTCTCIFMSLFT